MSSDPRPPIASLEDLRQQLQQLRALHVAGALDEAGFNSARIRLEQRIVEAVMAQPDPCTDLHTEPLADIGPEVAQVVDRTPVTAVDAQPAASTSATAVMELRPTGRAPGRPGGAAEHAPRASRRMAWGLGAAATAIGLFGYAWTGSPALAWQAMSTPAAHATAADRPAAAAATQGQAHELSAAQITAMATRLEERLQQQPDDADGWAMLARTLAVSGEHGKAVAAFEKAGRLRADDAMLLADHADALAMTQQRRLSGEPLRLVQRALALDPDNLKALSLAGSEAFARQDYAQAIGFWEQMQRKGPADHALVTQVGAGLAEARRLATGAAAAPATASTATTSAATAVPAGAVKAVGDAMIEGVVTLAEPLRARAGPDDTVFVYARAAQGSRMPLAILRSRVRELPLTFRLDDSLAMSPAARLSGAQQVVVEARVSASGGATPQPGDLLGRSDTVAVGARGLRIEIAQVQPQ
jgi:cytochrome c-type biogenesis protein CcmH